MRGHQSDLPRAVVANTAGAIALMTFACRTEVDGDVESGSFQWRFVAVVDLSGSSTVRAAFRSLNESLNQVTFVEQEVFPEDLLTELDLRMVRYQHAPLATIFVLSEPSDTRSENLWKRLEAANVSGIFGRRVFVAEDPASWGALPSMDGYVQAGSGFLATDAAQVTLQACSLISPVMMTGIDLNDWCLALGDVDVPSTLSRAFWKQKGPDRAMHFLDAAEHRAIETAGVVAALPLYPCTRVHEMNAIVQAISKIARPDATIMLSAPGMLIHANEALNAPYSTVMALCKPRQT